MGAPEITVLPDAAAVAEAAAERIVKKADRAIRARGRFVIALSGGSTPERLYRRLRETPWSARLPWDGIVWTFGDERTVPPDDEDSNFRMVREALFDHAPVPASHIFRMEGERHPDEAAERYEDALRSLFPGDPWPRADLVLLGMGDDGHTASLFPDSPALGEEERWIVANPVESKATTRLTWTFPAINAARDVVFLIAGASKVEMFDRVFRQHADPPVFPSQRIQPRPGTLTVLVDEAAHGK